jgi:Spx/MgsR family transcriptional regulator
MIHVYGIKNCDSVKKALWFLDTKHIPYTFHDFKSSPVSYEIIQSWVKRSDISRLFNTKGTTYRTLKLKSLNLDEHAKIEWMAKENRLIKRPVIETDTGLIVGFDLHQYEGIFNS